MPIQYEINPTLGCWEFLRHEAGASWEEPVPEFYISAENRHEEQFANIAETIGKVMVNDSVESNSLLEIPSTSVEESGTQENEKNQVYDNNGMEPL